jgi:hypothetical protein
MLPEMHQVQLDDNVFEAARRRAAQWGYPSMHAFIANVVERASDTESDNLDHLFTPEKIIANLQQISANPNVGGKLIPRKKFASTFEGNQQHGENHKKELPST